MLTPERLASVRQIFARIHHVAIATTGPKGEPHNTPVFAVFDDSLNMFWASSPQAVHSQNIARNRQVFIVVFDSSTGKGGGVFIEARAAQLTEPQAIKHALQVTENVTHALRTTAEFTGDSQQRMYCAEPLHIWANMSQKDSDGRIVVDKRYTIEKSELIGD